MPNFLVKKQNTWYARLDIPHHVRPLFDNKKTFAKSLKTGDKRRASELVHGVIGAWKALIEQALTDRILTDQRIEALAVEDEIRSRQEEAVMLHKAALGDRALPGPDQRVSIDELQSAHDKAMAALGRIIDRVAAAGDIDLLLAMKDVLPRWLKASYTKTTNPTEYIPAKLSFNQLLRAIEDKRLLTLTKEPARLKPLIAYARVNAASLRNSGAFSSSSIENFKSHLETQTDNVKSRDEYIAKAKKFGGYLTKLGGEVSFDAVASFLKIVSKKSKTQQKYISTLNKYWKWSIKHDSVVRNIYGGSANPFLGHDLPKIVSAQKEPYIAFTYEEFQPIFKATLKHSPELAAIVLTGYLTGCRIQEIGRLRREDIVSDDGVTSIFIRQSKTKAGIRRVPIHCALLPIIGELVERPRGSDGYLFCGGENQYGHRLDGAGKAFGRIKKSLGFGPLHTFHSLRKSFTTALHQNGFGDSIAPYLLGHEPVSFTLAVYSAGPSAIQKKQAIDSIKCPLAEDSLRELVDRITIDAN